MIFDKFLLIKKFIFGNNNKNLLSILMHGGMWNAIAQFGGQIINLAVMMILGRILSPREFGLVGMVNIFIGFMGFFTEFGLVSSIIQKKETDELDLNTAYWSGIGFAMIIYGAAFLIAPSVQFFYKQSSIAPIMRILFITLVIRSFAFVHYAIETKQLRYNKITIATLIGSVLSSALSIILALLQCGVWSLVWGSISYDLFLVIMYFILVKWKPSLVFSWQRFKPLFGFGAHIAINNTIQSFSANIDQLLLGKLVGAQSLGYYSMAQRFSRYPLEKIWGIFGKMLFPAFSTMQNDFGRLQRTIIKISIAGGFIITPFLVIIFFGAYQLVELFLGKKWLPIVSVIRVFTCYIFISSISFGDEPLLFAIKKVKQVNFLKIAAPIGICIFGFFGIKIFGIIGMAWILTIVTLMTSALMKLLLFRSIGLSFANYCGNLVRIVFYVIVLSGIGCSFFLVFHKIHLPSIVYLFFLTILIAVSAAVFEWKFKIISSIKK